MFKQMKILLGTILDSVPRNRFVVYIEGRFRKEYILVFVYSLILSNEDVTQTRVSRTRHGVAL